MIISKRIQSGIDLLTTASNPTDLCTSALLLMQSHNESKEECLFRLLAEIFYLPNEKAMQENYAKHRLHLTEILPPYDALPILLFPICDDFSILYDKAKNSFLLNRSTDGREELFRAMLMDIDGIEEIALNSLRRSGASDCYEKIQYALDNSDYDTLADLYPKFTACSKHRSLSAFFEGLLAFFVKKDVPAALHLAEECRRLMPLYPPNLLFLADCYRNINGYEEELLAIEALLPHIVKGIPSPETKDSPARRNAAIRAMLTPWLAPLYNLPEEDCSKADRRMLSFAGQFLPAGNPLGTLRFWTALENTEELYGSKARQIQHIHEGKDVRRESYSGCLFELFPAAETTFYQLPANQSYPCVLPIANPHTDAENPIVMRDSGQSGEIPTGKQELRYLRIEEPAAISAKKNFAVGTPIALRHSKNRKRLVLNLIPDALSWAQMKRENFARVPNILRFFEKGVIFQQNFSACEYTYPSVATIETGMHTHRTQVYHNSILAELPPSVRTLSEQMQALGYYTANLQMSGENVYCGALRGFDRLVILPLLRAFSYKGLRRLIDHLEAFHECDNYVHLHFADPHLDPRRDAPQHLTTQTLLDWRRQIKLPEDETVSVRLSTHPVYTAESAYRISDVDRQLGDLFRYIESHYAEDEYNIQLYSDHGSSIYLEKPWLLSETQTGAAMMMRGADVPQIGFVDEITSLLDFYPIMAKLHGFPVPKEQCDGNLPAAFGGKERTHAISQSRFIGQTYKLAIWTKEHEFQLESDEPTLPDGMVSLRNFQYHIYDRTESHDEIFSDALKDKFLKIALEHTEPFRLP